MCLSTLSIQMHCEPYLAGRYTMIPELNLSFFKEF